MGYDGTARAEVLTSMDRTLADVADGFPWVEGLVRVAPGGGSNHPSYTV
jgi:hypothetical protein